jgi:type IV secretory pathway TraG/TraD family ATPase VirD4
MTNNSRSLQLGTGIYGEAITLDAAARRRHVYLVGQTGTGKSTLLLNLLVQDIAAGAGLALLDPHGDLADALLGHVQAPRTNDLVYLDPADLEWPIGFNPLAGVGEDLKPVVADGIVSAFKHVWPESWGPRLDYILTHTLRALLDVPGASLLMLPRFLIDEAFRAALVDCHVRDPIVRAYWQQEFAGYSHSFRNEAIAPIQNKVGKVLINPALRNILAQPKSSITFRRLMDEGAIIICNLSKGRLGESTAHLIGALIVTSLAQAALSRADIAPERRNEFHLYADEFQSFATDSFALILSEARKYALNLTIGHQYLEQLPDRLRAAVFGNVGSIIACRTGAADAPILSEQIGLGGPSALTGLQNFHAWGRLSIYGNPSSPLPIRLDPPPHSYRLDVDRLRSLSRRRFGRPRRLVEERIGRFLKL